MNSLRQLINEILLLEYDRVQSVFVKQPAQAQATTQQTPPASPVAQTQATPAPQKAQPPVAQQPPVAAAPITKDTFLDKNKKMFAIGEGSKAALAKAGFTPEEIGFIDIKMNTMLLSEYKKYDPYFVKFGNQFKIDPIILKAMAIEETALLSRKNKQEGMTAAGLVQLTKPTLATLNANLPKGVHYSYESLANDPVQSIKITAHYIRRILIEKRNLNIEQAIAAYKTGPDSQNYLRRVTAYRKFIKLFGG